ncbi:transcriptional attenuator, LytR family [Lentzea fradiae]|uniref:Transcriptional attenuator, LytR family n=1 Tax=Lentzea fradiae TaxID=200378 RepID=A0A1G7QEG1_9PSEU|nr:LCP family protein [Lentzea fradiae]SDF96319.1 transcriptional attenuator, LytR family [Lentzea fradiae]
MNDLIRRAIAAEADERPDPATVLAGLRRTRQRKPFGLVVGVASLTVAAAAAAVVIPMTIKKTESAPVAAAQPATAQNVLLVGTDDVDFADAILLARFEADGSVNAVSVPRDIAVGDTTINRLYRDDPARLVSAVEQVTGQKVDHHAAVRMAEFGKIAQVVGGVEVCLKKAAVDSITGVSFPAGKQTLEGDRALAFLRQRHGLAHGDLDRVRRHQAFLAGLAAKISKDNALALAREAGGSIRVDSGWDVLAFAQRFQGPVKIVVGTLPVGEPVTIADNVLALPADPSRAKQFVEQQFAGGAPAQDGCVD